MYPCFKVLNISFHAESLDFMPSMQHVVLLSALGIPDDVFIAKQVEFLAEVGMKCI